MTPERRPEPATTAPARHPRRATATSALLPPPATGRAGRAEIDWAGALRLIERKRRLVARLDPAALRPFRAGYFPRATDVSFCLEGLDLPPADLAAALAPGGAARRAFRSRQQQRARNHVAILRRLETLLARGGTLRSADVIRWYTSVACGLSTARLDEPTAARLDAVVRQVNSPHLRLRPALREIARLHRQMLADPVVPGFNGILARLLLRYHLGRCGLPPVLFAPEADRSKLLDEHRLLERLLEMILASYAAVLDKKPTAAQSNRIFDAPCA